jgi:hypothetical protein
MIAEIPLTGVQPQAREELDAFTESEVAHAIFLTKRGSSSTN